MRKLLAAVLMAGVLLSGAPEAGAQTSGLSYVEDTVFTVLDGVVQVDITVRMSNTTVERRSGNTIYYSYFDRMQQVVPRGATNVSIVSRGSTLSTTSEPLDEDFDLYTARLPTDLRPGQSRTVEISFVLPEGAIRGEGVFFSNAAFHSFPIWSFSDPGTGSLVLRVPENAELVEFGGGLDERGTEDGFVRWVPSDFSVPEDVFSFVTVTIDEALVSEEFTVAGQQIVLRTWPGDDVWATFARDTIEKGLPALESAIGLPVPDQDSLEITESVAPYFYGYAGWYDPADTTIEVGNELDDTVMLHELSHAWFNDALFEERWVNEGLAEEFTWRTQRELGWPTEATPHEPGRLDPAALALVDWSNSLVASPGDDDIRATEEYGYHTSWYTVHELAQLIGLDGLQDVIRAADADTISYVGDDPLETTAAADDWRRLLDLASEAAPNDTHDAIEELFVSYVIADGWEDELEARQKARDAYASFLNETPEWRVPADVRVALTNWDFDTAVALIDEATSVLDRYEVLDAEADRRVLALSNAAQIAYEADAPDFEAAMRILDAQAEAIPAIATLRETATQPLSTNQRWGIGEVDLTALVDHAEAAFEVDRFDQIAAAQRDMDAALAAAEELGATRVLWVQIGSAATAMFVVLGIWTLRRHRRNRLPGELVGVSQSDVVLSA